METSVDEGLKAREHGVGVSDVKLKELSRPARLVNRIENTPRRLLVGSIVDNDVVLLQS